MTGGRSGLPVLLGSAVFALFGGVALLLLAANDLSLAGNDLALATVRRALRWALAGAALVAAPLGSAVVTLVWDDGMLPARSEAWRFFALTLVFAAAAAWLGLTAILRDYDLTEASRDPALRPTAESLAKRRSDSFGLGIFLLVLLLIVSVPCAGAALIATLEFW